MDKQLLQKFFRNQCAPDEIDKVYDWFQTKEGKEYFERKLDRDMRHYADEENLLLYPDVPTNKIFQKITSTRSRRFSRKPDRNRNGIIRVAVAFLFCSVLAGSYLISQFSGAASDLAADPTYRTVTTQNNQHRLITLGDGTRIRLNSNSSVTLPEPFAHHKREISLQGEAWFHVVQDENRPFIIQADQASISVLGTEFNVKVDTLARNVQVAVADGKVSLNNFDQDDGRGAVLTQDTFAIYNLDNEEILIEQTPVANYLSWINGRLTFYNDPLWQVSRYLERIYNVRIRFDEQPLGYLALSLDIAKDDIESVLDIIARTLNLEYNFEESENNVLWTQKTEHLQTPNHKPQN